MYRQSVTIAAKQGIHTRPAALLVQQAKQFPCDIIVFCNGKQASAKSLYRLQTLSLVSGTEIEVTASGDQAEQAVDSLCRFIATLE
ncbi:MULTISPECIES: HPr family phosphocarrier protein [Ferrimonas]|uniref:HPr family phosphocarrier protein n=1 Tax=Ferrimonas TaxID=44011 RepID=UPI000429F4F5|nr:MULTISPECIES: HPr family phosphocarrier protein [Ferrimonas]USD35967.1 HPr family phosphocarrier protein [Ferrimonas sp. SCSIO 43195]